MSRKEIWAIFCWLLFSLLRKVMRFSLTCFYKNGDLFENINLKIWFWLSLELIVLPLTMLILNHIKAKKCQHVIILLHNSRVIVFKMNEELVLCLLINIVIMEYSTISIERLIETCPWRCGLFRQTIWSFIIL